MDEKQNKKNVFKKTLQPGEAGMYMRNSDLKKVGKLEAKFIGPFRIAKEVGKPNKIQLLDRKGKLFKEVKESRVKRVHILNDNQIVDLKSVEKDSDDESIESIDDIPQDIMNDLNSVNEDLIRQDIVEQAVETPKRLKHSFPLSFSQSRSVSVDADYLYVESDEEDPSSKKKRRKIKKKKDSS